MKSAIERRMSFSPRTRSFLSWGRNLFLIFGVLALGYVGFALLDAKLYQTYETGRFEEVLKAMGPRAGSGEPLKMPSFRLTRPHGSEPNEI